MNAVDLIPFLDLTSLNDDDTPERIQQLCQRALTPQGSVAAVCVYPKFVACAKKALNGAPIHLATVMNFPQGDQALAQVVSAIRHALAEGADEIDVVMPYRDYLQGKEDSVFEFVRGCVAACGGHAALKVILETGALKEPDLIFKAACLMIKAGADFIKTSTGKLKPGATLEAADNMFRAIQTFPEKTVGFKAAGGIRTVGQALDYMTIAAQKMGQDWVSPQTMRFGASQLLDEIMSDVF